MEQGSGGVHTHGDQRLNAGVPPQVAKLWHHRRMAGKVIFGCDLDRGEFLFRTVLNDFGTSGGGGDFALCVTAGKRGAFFLVGHGEMLGTQVLSDFLQFVDPCNLQMAEIIVQSDVMVPVRGVHIVESAILVWVEGQTEI